LKQSDQFALQSYKLKIDELEALFIADCQNGNTGNTKGGSITVPLTSCLTGLESGVTQLNVFVFCLQNRLIQTGQTGGQWYSDTSPFSIPWVIYDGCYENCHNFTEKLRSASMGKEEDFKYFRVSSS